VRELAETGKITVARVDDYGLTTLHGYTVADLENLVPNYGALVIITNETGGDVPAFWDGTNWRRVTDREIVVAAA
jgi:hypothetical protein